MGRRNLGRWARRGTARHEADSGTELSTGPEQTHTRHVTEPLGWCHALKAPPPALALTDTCTHINMHTHTCMCTEAYLHRSTKHTQTDLLSQRCTHTCIHTYILTHECSCVHMHHYRHTGTLTRQTHTHTHAYVGKALNCICVCMHLHICTTHMITYTHSCVCANSCIFMPSQADTVVLIYVRVHHPETDTYKHRHGHIHTCLSTPTNEHRFTCMTYTHKLTCTVVILTVLMCTIQHVCMCAQLHTHVSECSHT